MRFLLSHSMLRRVVLVGAVVFAAFFLCLAVVFASGEPQGFKGGVQMSLTGSQDLRMRHNEVRLMLRGENPYLMYRNGQPVPFGTELLAIGRDIDPDYFPSTLLSVLPMAWLSFDATKLLWLLVNLGSTILLVQTLRWMLGPERPAAATQALMICLWICGVPFWSSLAMGQASLFSMAFTLAAFRADTTGRHLLAGLLLALGVFKYALVWPLVLFLFILQWRWRCLLVGGGIHLVVHLALCRVMQANPVTIFADVLDGNSKVFHRDNLLTVWLPFRSWNRLFPEHPLPAQWLGALLLAALLAALVWLWLRRDKNDRRNLLVWVAVLTLLAVMSVNSRIFAHMYALPVLLLACAPAAGAFTPFQRGRLIAYVLYLGYVPSGADNLGLPAQVQQGMMFVFNIVLAALAFELGRHLLRTERPPLTPAARRRSRPEPPAAAHP